MESYLSFYDESHFHNSIKPLSIFQRHIILLKNLVQSIFFNTKTYCTMMQYNFEACDKARVAGQRLEKKCLLQCILAERVMNIASKQ